MCYTTYLSCDIQIVVPLNVYLWWATDTLPTRTRLYVKGNLRRGEGLQTLRISRFDARKLRCVKVRC
jgi:hypothetical protein